MTYFIKSQSSRGRPSILVRSTIQPLNHLQIISNEPSGETLDNLVIPTENLDVIHDSDQNTQHETWSEDSNEITPNDNQLANNISVNIPTNENGSHDNNKRKNEHDTNFDSFIDQDNLHDDNFDENGTNDQDDILLNEQMTNEINSDPKIMNLIT